MTPLIVTVTGPSNSGKTVLAGDLIKDSFEPLTSSTTRRKRRGERDGTDYHFLSHEAFDKMLAEDAFIEHISYDNQNYGISSQEALRAFAMGKPAVLVAEPHGVEQIGHYCRARGWKELRAFVYNPPQVLVERMLERVVHDLEAEKNPLAGEAIQACLAEFAKKSDGLSLFERAVQRQGNPDLAEASGAEKETIRRILRGMAAQLGLDDDGETAMILDSHAPRMGKMLDFEQRRWVGRALSGEDGYDMIFDRFDSNNRQEIVAKVINAAKAIMVAAPDESAGLAAADLAPVDLTADSTPVDSANGGRAIAPGRARGR